jgi:hypothetical protein
MSPLIIYIYVKQHSVTGLKYFGKCTTRDPLTYLGSGKYWLRHIKKHGTQFVVTLNVWEFEIADEATKFALEYSNANDIVKSEEWANLIEENALDGSPLGVQRSGETKQKITNALLARSDEVKERIKLSNTGKKRSDIVKEQIRIRSTGRLHTQEAKDKVSRKLKEAWANNPREISEETKMKISIAGTGRLHTQEAKDKIGIAHKDKNVSDETKLKQSEKAKTRLLTCDCCGITLNAVTIRRWHNSKCKYHNLSMAK